MGGGQVVDKVFKLRGITVKHTSAYLNPVMGGFFDKFVTKSVRRFSSNWSDVAPAAIALGGTVYACNQFLNQKAEEHKS